MDRNAIRKYATWARRELIEKVAQKAQQYGIEDGKIHKENLIDINCILLSDVERRQRKALITKISIEGYEQVIEEVAYTWFNRIIAIRFMEVNGYLPDHIRFFSNEQGMFNPQIVKEAFQLEWDGIDRDRLFEMKQENRDEELFKYLLIKQCNELNKILPGMFQKIADYTELLLPDYLLRDGSVTEQLVSSIPEEDWTDQVQILGWLYQDYNIEPKEQAFAALKKNKKIDQNSIPAATQIFTNDWIVRYLVENSLGKMWVEGHPGTESLIKNWKYYLDPDKTAEEKELHKSYYTNLNPLEIKCIDPCCGSGHILVYLFDVLVQIYEAAGYSSREAVRLIIENNIYGMDIDPRAAQLAYFSIMMIARKYDRRIFKNVARPKIYAVSDCDEISPEIVSYFSDGDKVLDEAINRIMTEFHNSRTYGSLISTVDEDWDLLRNRLEEINEEYSVFREDAIAKLEPLITQAKMLNQKYDIVCTNPPYLSSGNMDKILSEMLKDKYPDSKSDLCTCFIEKSFHMLKPYGISSMITMESWMSLSSFKKLREKVLADRTIMSLVHMPYLGKGNTSLGINFGTSATVIRNIHEKNAVAIFDQVTYLNSDEDGTPVKFPVEDEFYRNTRVSNFEKIPGNPITAYYASDNIFNDFAKGVYVSDVAFPASGTSTGDNEKFLRLWHEIPREKINFSAKNGVFASGRWFPCNKGGAYRKWAGGNEYVIDWENDGMRIRNCPKAYLRNVGSIFKRGLTWSKLGSGAFSMRYFSEGYICESIGCCLFEKDEDLFLILGLMNSNVAEKLLKIINPSMGRQPGYIGAVPFLMRDELRERIYCLVEENIKISQADWDDYETSWNFRKHPLSKESGKIEELYREWKKACQYRFDTLKQNEEELNRIFISLYNLDGEIGPFVSNNMISVSVPSEQEAVKTLLSFFVGCKLGRFKMEGIQVDTDNIIPVCDDEYFKDDIVSYFINYLSVIYGKENLDDNLRFISTALGGNKTSIENIRDYFINSFYDDHCKVYQKRPIYWMFDSGKNNGFKCLSYIHRYQPDLIARIRTDYVHELQSRYKTILGELDKPSTMNSSSDYIKGEKKIKKIKDQDEELHKYEEQVHHLSDQMISINIDDGVMINYAKFQDVLKKIK